MKLLLKKEFKLTASILSYLFILFSIMTLIPSYPILVGSFFVCFGVFHTFQSARETNDILFSAMLPIKKSDVVKSKYIFACLIQLASFIVMTLLVLLRILFLNKFIPYSINSLMNANFVYLGYILIIFACFNIIFIGGFFKTVYKIGIPFFVFTIVAFLIIAIGEVLHFIPGLEMLNMNFHFSHLIIFLFGLLIYIFGTYFSLKISEKRFNELDL